MNDAMLVSVGQRLGDITQHSDDLSDRENDRLVETSAERLALARALMSQRQFARAIAVADGFDSPATQTYVAYLAESLMLRAAASESIGLAPGRLAYRARLDALRRSATDSARK